MVGEKEHPQVPMAYTVLLQLSLSDATLDLEMTPFYGQMLTLELTQNSGSLRSDSHPTVHVLGICSQGFRMRVGFVLVPIRKLGGKNYRNYSLSGKW